MFAAVLAGEHIAQAFRNKDVRAGLRLTSGSDRAGRQSSARVGRVLKRLHVRRLIAKVPRTRRCRVTDKGRRVLGDALMTYRRYQRQAA